MSPEELDISQVSKSLGDYAVVYTIERITTQGRLSFLTIACDNVDLPDPELPATPMMLTSAHGGE